MSKERKTGFTDEQILDFMDRLWDEGSRKDGLKGWVLRKSATDRGYRLHTTSRKMHFKTVREAITNAMLSGEGEQE